MASPLRRGEVVLAYMLGLLGRTRYAFPFLMVIAAGLTLRRPIA